MVTLGHGILDHSQWWPLQGHNFPEVHCHPYPTPCCWGSGLMQSLDFPPSPHSWTDVI